jgi:DNA-binding MarR family transcriptional regulator
MKTRTWNPSESASFWVNRASRALQRAQDAKLAALGFSMSHMPILHALEDGAPRSQKDLALAARVEQATMAEMIKRLERDGVVTRKPNPLDGRGVLVTLTARAKKGWPSAKRELTKVEDEAVAGLTRREAKTLRELLRRVVEHLDPASCDGERGE